MRMLIGLGFCLPLAFATPAEQPTRPLVILVHGRGHVGADTAWLRREWKRDLDSSLTLVGLPRLRDEDVRLAWYADILDPESDPRCTKATTETRTGDVAPFMRGLLGALASLVPADEAPEARALLGDVLYVMDHPTRCAAQERVGKAIEAAMRDKRPVVVVAYSLGAIVTYEFLKGYVARDGDPGVSLVTIGSPLGNREIRELLGARDSLSVPSIVRVWENVYDPDDAFAAPLNEEGRPTRAIRDRVTERRAGAEAHHIARYLRDAATGEAVGRALCESASNLSDSCRRLVLLKAG